MRAVGVVADIVANSERWYTSEKGPSCGMHDRKHEHSVNVRILGGASCGLRGLCQLGITGRTGWRDGVRKRDQGW